MASGSADFATSKVKTAAVSRESCRSNFKILLDMSLYPRIESEPTSVSSDETTNSQADSVTANPPSVEVKLDQAINAIQPVGCRCRGLRTDLDPQLRIRDVSVNLLSC